MKFAERCEDREISQKFEDGWGCVDREVRAQTFAALDLKNENLNSMLLRWKVLVVPELLRYIDLIDVQTVRS